MVVIIDQPPGGFVGQASNGKKARHQASRNTSPAVRSLRAEGLRQLQLVTSWQALTAEIPDATVIAGDPAHWRVAINALIRAIVLDGFETGHPAVTALAATLAPVDSRRAIRSWLAAEYRNHQSVPGFPLLDGPLLILSQYVLAETTRGVVGTNPGSEELAVLSRALDGMIPGVAGSVVAETLPCDDPLEALIATGFVAPGKVLESGLAILYSLVYICEADATTIPRRVA